MTVHHISEGAAKGSPRRKPPREMRRVRKTRLLNGRRHTNPGVAEPGKCRRRLPEVWNSGARGAIRQTIYGERYAPAPRALPERGSNYGRTSVTEPKLTLIDTATGEVVDGHSHEELTLLNERLGAELNGYRLRLANLQKEIRDLQGVEPEAEDIRFVLSYWAKRVIEEGWFTRKPSFRPGSEAWVAVRARLKDNWTTEQLCLVVDAVLAQPKGSVKRAWIHATSIFRNERNCSLHFENAQDPRMERVRGVRELPVELQKAVMTGEVAQLLARCECSHLRLQHSYPLEPLWVPENMVGWEPCRECICMDFGDGYGVCERKVAA